MSATSSSSEARASKNHLGSEHLQLSEHPVPAAGCLPGILPGGFGKIAGGLHGEGEQVEDQENRGQVFGAMPEIAVKVISIVFKYVEALVLDLPAGTPAFGDLPHIVAVDRQVGHPGKALPDLAAGRLWDLVADPGHPEGPGTGADGNILEPSVAVDPPRDLPLAGGDGAAQRLHRAPGQLLMEHLVACRPGGEDEAGPGPEDGIADGLAGEQVVAGTDGERCARASA